MVSLSPSQVVNMKTYSRKMPQQFNKCEVNFEEVCRLCLRDEDLTSIFDESCGNNIPFKIMACSSVRVLKGDGLPSQICKNCFNQMELAYCFKVTCERSDFKLHNVLINIKGNYEPIKHMEVSQNGDQKMNVSLGMSNDLNAATINEDMTFPVTSAGTRLIEIVKRDEKYPGSDEHEVTEESVHFGRVSLFEDPEEVSQHVIVDCLDFTLPVTTTMDDTMVNEVPVCISPITVSDRQLTIADKRSKNKRKLSSKENTEENLPIRVIDFSNTDVQPKTPVKVSMSAHHKRPSSRKKPVFVECKMENEPSSGSNENRSGSSNVQEEASNEGHSSSGGKVIENESIHTESITHSVTKQNHKEVFPFACDKCPKRFLKRMDLKRHLSVHDKCRGFVCIVCEKWFPNKTSYNRHERIHTGEKPYSCTHCEKCFSQGAILARHIMTHTGEKPFQCNVCQKSFTQREGLRVHMRHHNTDQRDIQQHACPLCEKSFCHPSGLSRHLLIHTGKTFDCNICNKVFTDSSSLKRHCKRHADNTSLQQTTEQQVTEQTTEQQEKTEQPSRPETTELQMIEHLKIEKM